MKKHLFILFFLGLSASLFAIGFDGSRQSQNRDVSTLAQVDSAEADGMEIDLTGMDNQDEEEVTNGEQTLRLSRSIAVQDHLITGPAGMQIYNLAGQNVTEMNGRLPSGLYIVRVGKQALKVRIN